MRKSFLKFHKEVKFDSFSFLIFLFKADMIDIFHQIVFWIELFVNL